MPFCAHCYQQQAGEPLLRCSQCSKRCYCSDCRTTDWNSCHQRWYGAAGEIDEAFEVCNIPGKGLGLFALRPLKRFDAVMIERPLITTTYPRFSSLPAPAVAALEALCPAGAPVQRKIVTNQVALASSEDDGSGVFVTMSHSNHSCVSNVEHYFLEAQGVMLLTACRDIAANEELCIAYLYPQEVATAVRRRQLRTYWGFDCTCAGCCQPDVTAQLDKLLELDAEIPALAGQPQTSVLYSSQRAQAVDLIEKAAEIGHGSCMGKIIRKWRTTEGWLLGRMATLTMGC